MKLSNLKTSSAYAKPTQLDVLHPSSGLPIGVTIDVWGSGSQTHRDAEDAIARTSLQRIQKQGRSAALDPANARAAALDLAVAITASWRGVEDDAGSPIACTAEAARTLYIDCPWLLEQVGEAAADPKRFFKSSPPS